MLVNLVFVVMLASFKTTVVFDVVAADSILYKQLNYNNNGTQRMEDDE